MKVKYTVIGELKGEDNREDFDSFDDFVKSVVSDDLNFCMVPGYEITDIEEVSEVQNAEETGDPATGDANEGPAGQDPDTLPQSEPVETPDDDPDDDEDEDPDEVEKDEDIDG